MLPAVISSGFCSKDAVIQIFLHTLSRVFSRNDENETTYTGSLEDMIPVACFSCCESSDRRRCDCCKKEGVVVREYDDFLVGMLMNDFDVGQLSDKRPIALAAVRKWRGDCDDKTLTENSFFVWSLFVAVRNERVCS